MDVAARSVLDEVPAAHVLALCLRGAGFGDASIARHFDVDAEAVPALLEVAAAKVRRAVHTPVDTDGLAGSGEVR